MLYDILKYDNYTALRSVRTSREFSQGGYYKKGRGDSGKVIWSDTVYITNSSSTDEHTDFVLYVILLRNWHFQKYQYINPIIFWVPGT